MADVFISYKREDRTWAERVDAALRDAGFTTWWDTSLVAGEHFNEAIDRELNSAQCVVVIWSKRSHQSNWVQAEAVRGFSGNALVACRIDDVVLRYPFGLVQTADLEREGTGPLIEGVQRKLDRKAEPHHHDVRATAAPSWLQTLNRDLRARWLFLLLIAPVIALSLGSGGAFDNPIAGFVFGVLPQIPAIKLLDAGLGRRARLIPTFCLVALSAFLSLIPFGLVSALFLEETGWFPRPPVWVGYGFAPVVAIVFHGVFCWFLGRVILRRSRWA
jgi:hypothetical protein